MIRNSILPAMTAFLGMAGLAVAQAPLPAPPAPAAPVAPLAPGVPFAAPVPAAPPVPLAEPFDFNFDFSLGPEFQAQMEQVGQQIAQANLQLAQTRIFQNNGGKFYTAGFRNLSNDDRAYTSGQRALDRSQWDEALSDFTRVAANAGSRADGALYWKAYALNKLGRRDEASAALDQLRKTYAKSAWLNDANALAVEIQQAAGQNVSPESQPDEELKLIALNALVRSDPDRAMPLLENLLKGPQSPRVKERALFVLGQSDAPRAQQLLEQIARGGGNPDLQVTAINYLGAVMRKGKGDGQMLLDIYNASTDVTVKRAVLSALRTSGDTDRLMQAARAEKSAELRAQAVRLLGNRAEAGDALVALYGSESDAQVKQAIAQSLFAQRNAKALVDLARKESDPSTKREIVRLLSTMQTKEATDYLMELLK